jgi:hypothetical protein
MRRSIWHRRLFVTTLVAWASATSASGQTNVVTQHNDIGRTGANLSETTLTTSNVGPATFGKLFSREVDGNIYAQPLYLSKVTLTVPGAGAGVHSIVIIATEHNSVYAFDAVDMNTDPRTPPLWGPVTLGPSVPSDVLSADITKTGRRTSCKDLTTEVGITSTPAIGFQDNAPKYLYVVAKSKENGQYFYRLHLLDLTSGAILKSAVITGQVTGKGGGSDANGVIAFQPRYQLNRPGLLLVDGVLYLAFGGHCDQGPYHGWLFAYKADDLSQLAVYNTTSNGQEGAIWQSGQGPACDAEGNIYVVTGNGSSDGQASFSDSVLKLKLDSVNRTFNLVDWFTPYNQADLRGQDLDLGSGGPLLVPNSNLVIAGGKEGKLYLIDRSNMGHIGKFNDSQIVQSVQVTRNPVPFSKGRYRFFNIHGSPVYWQGPSARWVYINGEEDYVKAYALRGDGANLMFTPTWPVSQSTVSAPTSPPFQLAGPIPDEGEPVVMPGGIMAISANGSNPGTGILWVSTTFDKSANQMVVTGILRAFDASDLSHEIWNSKMHESRDDVGMFAKFCPPTIADGKVFISSFAPEDIPDIGPDKGVHKAVGKARLVVYGLLTQP